MTSQKDIDKIAEIIRKRIEHLKNQKFGATDEEIREITLRIYEISHFAKRDLADYFEEEAKKNCSSLTELKNKFNRTQFLKKAGVQE